MFRSDTGEPLVTMDARLITERRTATISALATQLLAKPEARVLAILGSGVQARSHCQALQLVRNFEQIYVWSRTSEHARRFAEEIGAQSVSAEEAVRQADVVVNKSLGIGVEDLAAAKLVYERVVGSSTLTI